MSADPTFQTADYEEQLGEPLDFRGLRLPALAVDQMLGAAIVHTDRDSDPLPPYDAVCLRVHDDTLVLTATDRTTAYREQRTVNQEGPASDFLLQAADLRTVRSLLRSGLAAADKPDKAVLPVDLVLGDTGFLEVILQERRVICAPRDATFADGTPMPFPDVEKLIHTAHLALDRGLQPLDVALNADLVARMKPLQKAGDGVFRIRRGQPVRDELNTPVLLTPLNPHPEHALHARLAEVLIMPIGPAVEAAAEAET